MPDLPQIETERLILRPPAAIDLDGWAALMADEAASIFIGGPGNRRDAWANLCLMRGGWHVDGLSNFSVIEKATGRWIGRAGPWCPPDWPGNEIGWAFQRSFWGQGFAQEAAKATMRWVAENLGWRDIVHIIHPENLRSIALAERLGSRMIRQMPPEELPSKVPLLVYGQTLAA